MILVADSGSSKTDWALIDSNQTVIQYNSVGINPFFLSSNEIYHIVKETFVDLNLVNRIEMIYFYGAGCVKNLNTNIVTDGLKQLFPKAEINVDDDMIGAARSIFGNKQGIACILGTGANSSKYDGKGIIEKIPTLGFILGDEASGAYFGKILINNYFKKIMPDDLAEKFKHQYKPEVSDVLNKVYKQPYPNRYLAKFTHFLYENINHQYAQNLLQTGFGAFITSNIEKYKDYKSYSVGFVGSIAYHFSDLLMKTGKNFGIDIVHIVEKPIDGLIEYHKRNY